MRKIYTFLFSALFLSGLNAQTPTTLFQDDFENGSSNWTLDAPLLGDAFVVDNNYDGYVIDMGGFIQIPLFPDSPDQPSTFTNAPRSNYLHIQSPMLCAITHCNATYSSAGDFHATLSNAIDFTDYENATVQYSYFVEGHADSAYAYLEYSLDSITWIEVGAKLVNQNSWNQVSVSIPELTGEGSVYFRFKWKNLGYSESNLGIGIDEIKIEAIDVNAAKITSLATDLPAYCSNTTHPIIVTFNPEGDFTSGNVFTATISDENGDFTNEQTIGTLISTNNGTLTISGALPVLPSGNGYKIKVSSTLPVAESILDTAITILDAPVVSVSNDAFIVEGESATLTANGATNYTWTPSGSLNTANGASVTASPSTTTTYTVTGTDANGCSASATVTVNVSGLSVDENELNKLSVYPNPSSDSFHITVENGTVSSLEVYSLDGKKISNYSFNGTTLNLQENGVYILQLQVDNQQYTRRIVKL